MLQKKKVLFALIIILFAGLLIGCGGSDSGSNNNAANSEEASEVAEEAAVPAGDPVEGETLYQQSCLACHGADAKGLPNLGKDLTTSELMKTGSDEELLAFVKSGRPSSDPENTTGIDMPPKGGNPALTDEQIIDILAYIHTLEE